MCLLFGLAIAPFIFNLFGESLHWILVSFLRWVLVDYLDNFVSVFTAAQTLAHLTRQACQAYNQVTNLLGIPKNYSKDTERTKVIVFGTEINKESFTARLLKNKLDKVIKATEKVLAIYSATFLDIHESLVGFLLFYSQAVQLERVFMRKLWDFVNKYCCIATKLTQRRILAWVREDLE